MEANRASSEDELVAELDAAHRSAQDAYLAKDLSAYEDCFSSGLEYTRPDGVTISRSQLMRDVRNQVSGLRSARMEYERRSFKRVAENRVTEVVLQRAWVEFKFFLFFTKRWSLEREGAYTWVRSEDGRWRIEKAVVRSEAVS